MTNKSLVRILITLVLVLALINAGVLSFMFLKKRQFKSRDFGRSGHSTERLFDRLEFTEEQRQEFINNAKKFREQMDEQRMDMRKLRESMREISRSSNIDSAKVESLAAAIGKSEAEMLKNMMYHMSIQRKLCTPEQLPKFDQWHDRMPGPPGKRPGPPRRQHRP